MIAETLAGIALVKSAVDGIKSTINTANDIGDIAKYVDNLLEGEKQVQQQRSKKSGNSLGDQFGIQSVAQEMIDAKLAQEKVQEMRQLVDMRFGHGTWQSILDERAKRIREAKEAAEQARCEAVKRHNEMMENIKMGTGVAGIVLATVGFLIFLSNILTISILAVGDNNLLISILVKPFSQISASPTPIGLYSKKGRSPPCSSSIYPKASSRLALFPIRVPLI